MIMTFFYTVSLVLLYILCTVVIVVCHVRIDLIHLNSAEGKNVDRDCRRVLGGRGCDWVQAQVCAGMNSVSVLLSPISLTHTLTVTHPHPHPKYNRRNSLFQLSVNALYKIFNFINIIEFNLFSCIQNSI
jgi:hypothetical protein